jgi:hypothetical protein
VNGRPITDEMDTKAVGTLLRSAPRPLTVQFERKVME